MDLHRQRGRKREREEGQLQRQLTIKVSNGELQLTLHTRFVYRKVGKVLRFRLSNSVLGTAMATSSPKVLCLRRGKGKQGGGREWGTTGDYLCTKMH